MTSPRMKDRRQNRIEENYEKAFSQLGELQTVFPLNAKLEMSKMAEQIARTDKILNNKIINTQQNIDIKGGYAAEEVFAESYNLGAILKGKESRALTSRYEEWRPKTGLNGNDQVADIAGVNKDVFSGNEVNADVIYKGQSKFCDRAETTAGPYNGMAQVKDGRPKYQDADAYLGPKDQINPTDGMTTSVKELAEARAYATEKRGDMPQAEALRDVAKKATDKVEFDEASGKGFTKNEANEIAGGTQEGKNVRKEYQDEYQTASTIKNMKQAAVGAAAISAVASGVFNSLTYIKMVREGKMTESEAVVKVIGETVASSADSAIKASANVGVQSMMVRYGTKEVTRKMSEELAKNGLRSMARTNAVTVGVICAVDLVKDLVKLGVGSINGQEFEERQGKNVLNTSSGVMGGAVGYEIGAAIGIAGMGLAGGIAGGLIAGLAMQFAIENHLEKPYRELVSNTAALASSMRVFEQVSRDIVRGQVAFGVFLEEEGLTNRQFKEQMNAVSNTGSAMKSAIDKL
jgi:hypothetical protein